MIPVYTVVFCVCSFLVGFFLRDAIRKEVIQKLMEVCSEQAYKAGYAQAYLQFKKEHYE